VTLNNDLHCPCARGAQWGRRNCVSPWPASSEFVLSTAPLRAVIRYNKKTSVSPCLTPQLFKPCRGTSGAVQQTSSRPCRPRGRVGLSPSGPTAQACSDALAGQVHPALSHEEAIPSGSVGAVRAPACGETTRIGLQYVHRAPSAQAACTLARTPWLLVGCSVISSTGVPINFAT